MEWVKIFETDAEANNFMVDGKPQLVIINDVRICLVRHKNNYSAIQDECPHKGESLSKGYLNFLGEIVCPWHNYCYEMRFGREISGRSGPVQTYPVKIDETGLFIGI
jgi:nitrite reductase/ring-hydroxylating ferredoxin subunit